MKIADSPSYGGIDFFHYSFKRFYRSHSLREFGHSIFDRLQGHIFGSNAELITKVDSTSGLYFLKIKVICNYNAARRGAKVELLVQPDLTSPDSDL